MCTSRVTMIVYEPMSNFTDMVQGCGARLFDDFTELHPGAAKELEAELQDTDLQRPAKNLGLYLRGLFDSLAVLSGRGTRVRHDQAGMGLPAYNTPSNTTAQSGNGQYQPSSLYLHVCMGERSSRTVLHQQDLSNITKDRKLFELLRARYMRLHRTNNWFTIRNMNTVQMSQVRLLINSPFGFQGARIF